MERNSIPFFFLLWTAGIMPGDPSSKMLTTLKAGWTLAFAVQKKSKPRTTLKSSSVAMEKLVRPSICPRDAPHLWPHRRWIGLQSLLPSPD
ncbi:hypothetical protein AAC387_Pa05g1344 [Persea americana]